MAGPVRYEAQPRGPQYQPVPVYGAPAYPVRDRRGSNGPWIAGGIAAGVALACACCGVGAAAVGLNRDRLFGEGDPAAAAPSSQAPVTERPGVKIETPEAKLERQDFHLLPGAKVTVEGGKLVVPAGAAGDRPEGATISLAGYALVLKSDARVGDVNADPKADPNKSGNGWNNMYDSDGSTGAVAFYIPGSDCNTAEAFAINTPWDGGNLEVVPLETLAAEFDEAVGHTKNPGGHRSVDQYDMGQGGMKVGTDLTAAQIVEKLAAQESVQPRDFHLLPGKNVYLKDGVLFVPAGAAEGYTEDVTVSFAGGGLVLKSDAKLLDQSTGVWTKMYDEDANSGSSGAVAFWAPGAQCSTVDGEYVLQGPFNGGNLQVVPADEYKDTLDRAIAHTKNPGGHATVDKYDLAQGGKFVGMA